jgi:molybdopterin converting factor small subunit
MRDNVMMRVCVKLFATLGRYHLGSLPGTPFEVELPEAAELADLIRWLALLPDEVKIIYVNGRTQPVGYVLQPGDDVGIFPPVGGG